MMNSNCPFCLDRFKEYNIKEYDYWESQIYVDDQYYIGRSVIVLKSRHITDINDLSNNEINELFEDALQDLTEGIDSLFSPDRYNYSSLGNGYEHLHLHVVPRYSSKRYYGGKEFDDEFFGQNYSQNYEKIKLDDNLLIELRNTIKEHIRKSR